MNTFLHFFVLTVWIYRTVNTLTLTHCNYHRIGAGNLLKVFVYENHLSFG
jgi:hypothetical protein